MLTFPALPAYLDATNDLWVVWCEHEARWHRHGAGTAALRAAGDSFGGHRVAHCECSKSPLYRFGYALVPSGPLTPEVEKSHPIPRAGATCPGCRQRRTRRART